MIWREPAESDRSKPQPAAAPVRVIIADDHKILRDGLVSVFEDWPDIEVIGEAADGEAAVELARQLEPDLIIMDITMPRINGIEATRIISREMPRVRIIGLSMHDDDGMAAVMRRAGAEAYVAKFGASEILIDAILNPPTGG